jgi:hypothetical protein
VAAQKHGAGVDAVTGQWQTNVRCGSRARFRGKTRNGDHSEMAKFAIFGAKKSVRENLTFRKKSRSGLRSGENVWPGVAAAKWAQTHIHITLTPTKDYARMQQRQSATTFDARLEWTFFCLTTFLTFFPPPPVSAVHASQPSAPCMAARVTG